VLLRYEQLRIRQSSKQTRHVHHWQALKRAETCGTRLLCIIRDYQ
jgi:hypothetical protein